MANLQHANLVGADFESARLQTTFVNHAILQAANLRYAFLRGAKFQKANLSRCDFRDAVMMETDLSEADLSYAVLDNAVYDYGTKWPDEFAVPLEMLNWDEMSDDERNEWLSEWRRRRGQPLPN